MFDNQAKTLRSEPRLPFAPVLSPKDSSKESDPTGDESCPAFGYLRDARDRALALQLRFRDGNSDWFSYSLLSSWRHNPSVGLLLKFTGDLIALVLIRGSNFDAMVNQSSVNLTDRGLQSHRITFIREMDEEELRKVGKGEPTIDRIEVGEFESNEQLREWLQQKAAAFLR